MDTAQLLRDPGQQMRYGYVSSRALVYTDPMGLFIANVIGAAVGVALDAAVQAVEINVTKTRDSFSFKQSALAAGAGFVGAGVGTSAAKLATSVGGSFSGVASQRVAATTTFYTANAVGNGAISAGAGYTSARVQGQDYPVDRALRDAAAGAILGTMANKVVPANNGVLDDTWGGVSSNIEKDWYRPTPGDVFAGALVAGSATSNAAGVTSTIIGSNSGGSCPK
ncbi:hypothetical protein [Saccharospirillum sp. MSK14-1]|uniref:hypothetical protein n=1 Tax=Saccharospirillum sp. MSK14-1 TaxID=1897632 RepID=UPI001304E81B|nr:hypothetical protein [Saccharospirillum sp. MSK14-1]